MIFLNYVIEYIFYCFLNRFIFLLTSVDPNQQFWKLSNFPTYQHLICLNLKIIFSPIEWTVLNIILEFYIAFSTGLEKIIQWPLLNPASDTFFYFCLYPHEIELSKIDWKDVFFVFQVSCSFCKQCHDIRPTHQVLPPEKSILHTFFTNYHWCMSQRFFSLKNLNFSVGISQPLCQIFDKSVKFANLL